MPHETNARRPDQLRDAIDRGEGSDKVSYPDPAASPLGTDEEAGGNPTSAAATETAFRHEVKETPSEPRRGAGSRGLLVGLWSVFGLVILAFVVFLVWHGV